MLGSIQRFRTESDQPFLNRGTVRRGDFFVFLDFSGVGGFEREKMLLNIFRGESGAIVRGPRIKASESGRAACVPRRVRGFKWQVPREFMRRGGELFKPQTVLLRLQRLPRGRKQIWRWPDTSSRRGIRRTWVRLGERGRRDPPAVGASPGRQGYLPAKKAEHVGSLELLNIGKATQIARELAYQIPEIEGQVVMSTFRASRGRKYRGL